MTAFQYTHFQLDFLPAVAELHRQRADAGLVDVGFLLSPGFENGKNICVAFDKAGNLAGYASILPHSFSAQWGGAQVLRFDLAAREGLDQEQALKDGFLDWARSRAGELCPADGTPQPVLMARLDAGNLAAVDYLSARGFAYMESEYTLCRDLGVWVVDNAPPAGIEVRAWRMPSQADKETYLAAYQQVFAGSTFCMDDLENFCRSEMWMAGTTFSAFSGEQLVGSVMACYDPNLKRNAERVGLIEHVFVLDGERGRGIGSAMLGQALLYLKQRGLRRAQVDLTASSPEAVCFFEAAGFELEREEVFLILQIE